MAERKKTFWINLTADFLSIRHRPGRTKRKPIKMLGKNIVIADDTELDLVEISTNQNDRYDKQSPMYCHQQPHRRQSPRPAVQARGVGSTIKVDRSLPNQNILCCKWSHGAVHHAMPHKFDIVPLAQQNDRKSRHNIYRKLGICIIQNQPQVAQSKNISKTSVRGQ